MNDLYQPVRDFEERMADFCGAPYAVSVESCSAALFLCCHYLKYMNNDVVKVPKKTYPSVAGALYHAGFNIEFINREWQDMGWYKLEPLPLIDSARFLMMNMYKIFDDNMVCLSFHHKKLLPIGRGGMILLNDEDVCKWLKCARHDGRNDKTPLKDDELKMVGWNFLMTPEQASRGIALMDNLKSVNQLPYEKYPDLSRFDIWKK